MGAAARARVCVGMWQGDSIYNFSGVRKKKKKKNIYLGRTESCITSVSLASIKHSKVKRRSYTHFSPWWLQYPGWLQYRASDVSRWMGGCLERG